VVTPVIILNAVILKFINNLFERELADRRNYTLLWCLVDFVLKISMDFELANLNLRKYLDGSNRIFIKYAVGAGKTD
jgi:hypothetical protein